jgi:hypothetical protein
MKIKTVEKGDLFIWNNAVKVKVVRTYKSGKIVNAVCSTLLVEWPARYSLPLSELFVPVESFDEFDNVEEYWGEGGPINTDEEVPTDIQEITQAEIDAVLAIVDGPVRDESGGELFDMTEEEFDEAIAGHEGIPVEVIGGSKGPESARPANDDGSATPKHSDKSEVRREAASGLTSHDPDAT